MYEKERECMSLQNRERERMKERKIPLFPKTRQDQVHAKRDVNRQCQIILGIT